MKHGRLMDTYRFPGFPQTPRYKGLGGLEGLISSTASPKGKMICSTCGHVHRVFYAGKIAWIRDLSHQIQGLQRSAEGLRNEESLRLKILTACCQPSKMLKI